MNSLTGEEGELVMKGAALTRFEGEDGKELR